MQRRRERDRGAEDRPDRRRSGAVEERPRALARTQLLEPPTAREHEAERRRERDHGREDRAADPVRRVSDRGDGRDHRTGRDLTERDRGEELLVGHPVVHVDRVALHQRDDHEAAAE